MTDDNNKEEVLEDDVEVVAEEALQDKLKKLRNDLKICHSEKAEYLAGWQRAKADFINARKDEEKMRMEFVKYSTQKILKEILPVLYSLELASGADGPIYKQLMDILKKEGVSQIEAKDKKFDPMYHEALEQTDVGDKETDGVIIEEMQKGYMLRDRVLRPSKVKVGIYKNI